VFLLPVLHSHLCAYFCIHGVCVIPLGVSVATLDSVLILWSFSEATAHALKVRTGMRSLSQPARHLTVYRFKLTRIYQLQDLYLIHTNSPYTRIPGFCDPVCKLALLPGIVSDKLALKVPDEMLRH